jgi:hypothetical protein
VSATEPDVRARSRRLMTVPIVVETGLLALFAFLLVETLHPDFRGGRFVTATLLLGLAFLGTVFVRDVAVALWGRAAKPLPAADTGPLGRDDDEAPQSTDWSTIGDAAVTLAGVFVAIFVFGVVLGTTLAAWVIFVWQSKLSIGKAASGAVLVGIVMPVLLASALELTLWPGIIPLVIPDWVGGGIPPPL